MQGKDFYGQITHNLPDFAGGAGKNLYNDSSAVLIFLFEKESQLLGRMFGAGF